MKEFFQKVIVKRVLAGLLVVIVAFYANFYGRNSANDALDEAQVVAASNNSALVDANADIDDLEAQLAQALASVPDLTIEPITELTTEPTLEPTVEPISTAIVDPTANWAQVKVTSTKLNLREIAKENKAGYPIMGITEPRVQYFKGDFIWVYKTTVRADGGDFYYQVASGSNGAGLYIRPDDVTLLD